MCQYYLGRYILTKLNSEFKNAKYVTCHPRYKQSNRTPEEETPLLPGSCGQPAAADVAKNRLEADALRAGKSPRSLIPNFKTHRMMNLRDKILITLFALGTIYWGCDSLIYDDLSDCPQGVYVKFYAMTPCESDSSFIGNVASLTLFAFDENDLLVASESRLNVNLDRNFEVLVPVSNGSFTFIAWAGVDDKFTQRAFTTGNTTKTDVMLTLNAAAGVASDLYGTQVWQGKSPVVFLPDPDEYGSVYKQTAVNLREVTNRIELIIEFDSNSMQGYDLRELHTEVSSANGALHIDATMPLKQDVLIYPSSTPTYNDNVAAWNYTMLVLKPGYDNNLRIWYTGNVTEGETVFNGDLIAMILLAAVDGTTNFDCDNDFTIRVVIKDYCAECPTNFSCAIYVNDYLVHSYQTELGI